MPLRAVIFDYGHTFLNFALAEERLLECYGEIRSMLEREIRREVPHAEHLVQSLSRQAARMVEDSYRARELEELDIITLYENALAAIELTLPRDFVHQIVEFEHRAMASSLAVPPENVQVLRDLKALGLKTGIVSNAHFLPHMMWEDIRRLGIAQNVDEAVFSAEIGVRKPHPAIFTHVLDALEVRPEDAVFVGDRVRDDIGGAQSLGMRGVLTCQFRQESAEGTGIAPDFIVDRLPDVVPYVQSLLVEL